MPTHSKNSTLLMNNYFAQQLKLDLLSIRSFYKDHFLSKLFVSFLFILFFTGLWILFYAYSSASINFLKSFEEFGASTAFYLLTASLLVILNLGLIFATISSFVFFLKKNPTLEYILQNTQTSLSVEFYYFTKSLFANSLVTVYFLTPILLPFTFFFSKNPLLTVIVSLLSLSILIYSVGSLFTVFTLLISFKKRLISILFSTLTIFSLLSYTLALIFPKNLRLLYESKPGQFYEIFNTLPLVQPTPLQQFFARVIKGDLSSLLVFSIFCLLVTTLSFVVFTLVFRPFYLSYSTQNKKSLKLKANFKDTNLPIVKKDLLYISRQPKELFYTVFLLLMCLAISLLTQSLKNIRPFSRIEALDLALFTYLWLAFYSLTYGLRLIMPLYSHEGGNITHLLTNIAGRYKIYAQKLISMFILTIPLLIIEVFIWKYSPLDLNTGSLMLLTLRTTFFVSLLCSTLGWLMPSFSLYRDDEKVSTSLPGILALLTTTLYTAIEYLYFISSANLYEIAILILWTILLIASFACIIFNPKDNRL